MEAQNKKWWVTLVLCVILGIFGGHSFYNGRIGRGVFQLLTLGGVGVWALIDFISILMGTFKDGNNNPIQRPASMTSGKTWALGIGIIVALLVIASLGDTSSTSSSGSASDEPSATAEKIGKPDQVAFHAKLGELKNEYNAVDGEMQKSKVYRDLKSFMMSYLNGGSFSNWEGIVDTIGTNEGGKKAYLEINSDAGGYAIAYATWNNELSDIADNSMISLGSGMYKQLEAVKEGDSVVFSGSFVRDDTRGFGEQSITEAGFVTDPKFVIRFSSIKKKDK